VAYLRDPSVWPQGADKLDNGPPIDKYLGDSDGVSVASASESKRDKMRLWASKVLAGGLISLSVILGISGAAFAYGPNLPTIGTGAGGGACSTAGCALPVNGTGFDPGSTVVLTGCGITPVSTVASATGTISTTVNIPAGAAGTCTITATEGANVATTTVTRGAAATVASATTSAPLALTGADISGLVAIAALAIAVGGVFVLSTRRRKLRSER
jgi:hypothetical protein